MLRTQGVKALVEEVLTTIKPPYSEDIVDEVCRAIEVVLSGSCATRNSRAT